MEIRGVKVDHATIQRWVFKFTPMLDKEFRKRKKRVGMSWRMDETYIKVKGEWRYLYRAVDKEGYTVDFLLTKTNETILYPPKSLNSQQPRSVYSCFILKYHEIT